MRQLVVFIYGTKGNHRDFGEYFPKLIESDPQLSEVYTVMTFQCAVGKFRYLFSKKSSIIDEHTRRLRKKILKAYTQYDHVAFVCHGLGGLVARQYIVENMMSQNPQNVDRILMAAVPNSRSDLARLHESLSWKDFQAKNICRHPGDIEKINAAWTGDMVKNTVAVKYILGDLDNMIDTSDALDQWGPGGFIRGGKKDHWSIFTPADHDDSVFLITKRFLLAQTPSERKYPENLNAISNILNWDLDRTEIAAAKNDMIHLVDILNQLRWRSRQLLCALIQKANQVSYNEMFVVSSDISKTMNFTRQELEDELSYLKDAGLIDIISDDESEKISLRCPDEKWLIWDQLKGYCQKTGISLRRLIVDLQFDLLDKKEQ